MPTTLAAVWEAVGAFFENAFSAGLDVITAIPILIAPTVAGIAGIVIGSAKRLLRVGGRRRG